jgi:AAA+ ATPase superfamily predicted ATPase
MSDFIDRENELASLEKEYRRESSFVVVYGRRRTGKTTLIKEFIKDKKAVFFLATEEGDEQNRAAFQNLAAEFSGSEALKSGFFAEWLPIFQLLLEAAEPLSRTAQKNAKLVIVIDEFQYLGIANPAFPSVLQKIWDSCLKDHNIMIILCGSLVSMMESQTLAYTSPLYGRRTGQIRLRQIPFNHYHCFFAGKTHSELVQFYALTGGIPKYIELLGNRDNVFTAIKKDVLNPNSFLYDEPHFLLNRELGQAGTYFSIIKIIAAGNHKLSSIAAAMGQKQTGLTKYLSTLMSLDILEREVPVTETSPEKSKRGIYNIKDNFLCFWFKFVYPNVSYIESGKSDLVMERIRRNFVDSHAAYVYEAICRESLRSPEKLFSGAHVTGAKWKFTVDYIGRWWDRKEEIDIVAYDAGGRDIIFGECKFRKKKTGAEVFAALVEKAARVEWKKEDRRDHFIIFSSGGYTAGLESLATARDDLVLIGEQ